MATKLLFKKNGKPVAAGAEVTLQWDSGYMPSGGPLRSWTDAAGCVYIEDCLLHGHSRKTETIAIRTPENNFALLFTDIVLTRGEQHVFLLEAAQREWMPDIGE